MRVGINLHQKTLQHTKCPFLKTFNLTLNTQSAVDKYTKFCPYLHYQQFKYTVNVILEHNQLSALSIILTSIQTNSRECLIKLRMKVDIENLRVS